MFGNHTSDKGLASRKCEELLKLGGKNRVFGTQVEGDDSQRREAGGWNQVGAVEVVKGSDSRCNLNMEPSWFADVG